MSEYPQEVHPWTIQWFESLPEGYQQLDRVQRNPEPRPWDGLTGRPFEVNGAGGWTVEFESEFGVRLSQEFNSPPGSKAFVQVWANPGATLGGDLQVMVLNPATQAVVPLVGDHEALNIVGPAALTGYVYPPANGRYQVVLLCLAKTIDAIPVAGSIPVLEAVNVARRAVDYDELPRRNPGEVTYYPQLRFMDGIGQIGGQFREIGDALWNGNFTNPDTCPEKSLRWLAQMMGIQRAAYRDLAPEDMRALLRNTSENGLAAVGSRSSLTEVAKTLLTGGKQCTVSPHPTKAHTLRVSVLLAEVPNGELLTVEAQLRASGVVPAGHFIQVVEASTTWDQWEAAAGANWNELEARAPRWGDYDSLGATFD